MLCDDISNDLAEIETDFGTPTFTWNKNDYPCLPDINNVESNPVSIGFTETGDVKLTVRLNVFTNWVYPTENDLITYQGKQFKIYSIQHPILASICNLICKELEIAYAR
jgi:hypothetical protein